MTTLRVLVDAAPSADHAFDYALTDDVTQRVARPGRGMIAQWPRSDHVVAIVAAPLLYVGTLALPPIAASRLGDAVRYALDDQLAASTDSMHIANASQQKDGRVRAFALSRDLMRAIVDQFPRLSRIVAEPALFAADGDWHWTFDRQGRGFLLRPDASAVAVLAASGVPAEIMLAVNQARRAAAPPTRIVAHACDDTTAMPAGTAVIDGVDVVQGASWSWDGSGKIAADPAQATDLRQREFADAATTRRRATGLHAWRPAIATALAALVVFVLAAVATSMFYSVDAWRDRRAAIDLAQAAGADVQDFPAAMAALAQRYAAARHAAREMAPDDALPLLARAAPALAGVPAGKWKRAVFAGGAWTLEFTTLDDATRDTLIRRLGDAGLTALYAANAGGLRVRVQS